jgi:hypothetical protein
MAPICHLKPARRSSKAKCQTLAPSSLLLKFPRHLTKEYLQHQQILPPSSDSRLRMALITPFSIQLRSCRILSISLKLLQVLHHLSLVARRSKSKPLALPAMFCLVNLKSEYAISLARSKNQSLVPQFSLAPPQPSPQRNQTRCSRSKRKPI